MRVRIEWDEIAFVAEAELDVNLAGGGRRRGRCVPRCLPALARVRRVAHSRTFVPQVACASWIGFSALGFGLWTTLPRARPETNNRSGQACCESGEHQLHAGIKGIDVRREAGYCRKLIPERLQRARRFLLAASLVLLSGHGWASCDVRETASDERFDIGRAIADAAADLDVGQRHSLGAAPDGERVEGQAEEIGDGFRGQQFRWSCLDPGTYSRSCPGMAVLLVPEWMAGK